MTQYLKLIVFASARYAHQFNLFMLLSLAILVDADIDSKIIIKFNNCIVNYKSIIKIDNDIASDCFIVIDNDIILDESIVIDDVFTKN